MTDPLLTANKPGSPFTGRGRSLQRTTLALLLISLPTAAFADAGTPMMWAIGFHLIVGNLLIGICEGLLVAWLFHLPRLRTVMLAIAANYFSMFVGMFILDWAWSLTLVPGARPGTCDLWAGDVDGNPTYRIAAAIPGRGDFGSSHDREKDLRPDGSSPWNVRDWFDDGGSGSELVVLKHGHSAYTLAADEPLLMWRFGSETVLPGDDMVFYIWDPEGGQAQVILFNLHSRRMAVLADGWSPVVVEPARLLNHRVTESTEKSRRKG